MFLLNKKVNLNKSETESKMKNSICTLKETNLALQLILISQIEDKTVMSWKSRERKEWLFLKVYFVLRKYLQRLYFISMYRVLNKLSEYIYFYISKSITLLLFCLLLILSKAFSVSLNHHVKSYSCDQKYTKLEHLQMQMVVLNFMRNGLVFYKLRKSNS